jgi:ribonucleotide monophosphatase NagD (HAD superfamily)
MDTDIQGGVQMGYKTVLVLSGFPEEKIFIIMPSNPI